MKVHLVQGTPKIGDISFNLNIILNEILNAELNNSTLICFPELFLTGYPMEDRLFYQNLKEEISLAINKVLTKSKECKNITIALPSPLFKRQKLYNALLIIKEGKLIGTVKKQHLPNYGVFDEKRYFSKGNKIEVFEIAKTRVVFSICEDIWYDDYVKKVNLLKPNLVIALNASPFEREKFEKRIQRMRLFNSQSIYLNQVLGYDEMVFDGQSFALSSKKELLFLMKEFKEQSFTFQLNLKHEIKILSQNELIYKALVFGLLEYCRQNGVSSVLLGLSGGIDSALCAKIAIDALGAENVLPVMLPSKISSEETKRDAMDFISLHKLNYLEIPIQLPVDTVKEVINKELSSLSRQNLQSRIRGTILMTLSNEMGKMLIATGNKSELAIGYCTIYGDMNGGFNPIKDLLKTEVYEICNHLNSVRPTFPFNIIQKSPTAELELNQTDEVSFGLPYKVLDFILKELIEFKKSTSTISKEIKKNGLFEIARSFRESAKIKPLNELEITDYVFNLLKKAQFKRSQSAVGTKISICSFGRDWRFGVKM